MIIRIGLIVALVAALAVGVLNFVEVKKKIETLITERNDWHGKYDATFAELNTTKETLAKTEADLKQTKDTLEATQTQRDKAVAEAAAQVKRAGELAEKLAKTTAERDEARQELAAYRATGRTPDQVLTLDRLLKEAQEAVEVANAEKRILQRELDKKTAELAKILEPDYKVRLPANLKGRVLAVDPKWEFVVLDIGESQNALVDGELLVNRNGKLVAKVRIQSVQKDRCIANIVPGWKLGEVLEGDVAIPAYPQS
jgi:septal ring factor EnvC (AmiA/AmiB activator)